MKDIAMVTQVDFPTVNVRTNAINAINAVLYFLRRCFLAVFLLTSISTNIYNQDKVTQSFLHRVYAFPTEKQCIEAALWHEARSEGTRGIKAVLEVITNRKNHPDFPSTYCKVILQPKQFSAFNKNPSKALRITYKPSEASTKALISTLAEKASTGRLNKADRAFDNKDVLYYHTTAINPSWSTRMKQVEVVKKHVFYSYRKEHGNS